MTHLKLVTEGNLSQKAPGHSIFKREKFPVHRVARATALQEAARKQRCEQKKDGVFTGISTLL